MADYHLERMHFQDFDKEDQIQAWLKDSDSELREEIKYRGFYQSKFTPMVRSMCKKDKPLSSKQRWCLAKYLTEDERTF